MLNQVLSTDQLSVTEERESWALMKPDRDIPVAPASVRRSVKPILKNDEEFGKGEERGRVFVELGEIARKKMGCLVDVQGGVYEIFHPNQIACNGAGASGISC